MSQPPIDPPPLVLSYREPDLVVEKPLLYPSERIFHFGGAIVLPIVCFAMSANGYPAGPDWQRGRWADYLGMFPRASVGFSFYPLLLFSMYAAARVIFSPRRAVDLLHVRVGLITGVVLAYQYGFIQVASIADTDIVLMNVIFAITIPPFFVAFLLALRSAFAAAVWNRRWYRGWAVPIFWLAIVALIGLPAVFIREGREVVFGSLVIGPLFLAPGLTMTTFAALALLARRVGQPLDRRSESFLIWITGWPLFFLAAWIVTYLRAVDAYKALPPSHDCYIATAATNGHPRFVRSTRLADRTMTHQLALLKAGEKAIAAHQPAVHAVMRRVYDFLGPRLAVHLTHPILADFAYATLKPAEWLTAALLAISAMRSKADRPGKRV